MSDPAVGDEEILAYLDEMLPPQRAAEIEQMLRDRAELRHRAARLVRRRDSGGHTVGEIWRRRQLSCPDRESLGMYVLGVADADLEDYIQFHTQTVGCRICLANLTDLQAANQSDDMGEDRRRRYFESSAGLLHRQIHPPKDG